jgi:hypothetical protein
MDQKPVRIHYFCLAAYRSKIKTAFAFFDEVFHLAATTVKKYTFGGLVEDKSLVVG